MAKATGNFEVRLSPLEVHDTAPSGLGRMSIDKDFSGDITGTSHGEMLATGHDNGAAAYVAFELVDGALDGKAGTFWLRHHAAMHAGGGDFAVTVVPGSATGELEGLTGSMTIDAANNHAYVLDYELPA